MNCLSSFRVAPFIEKEEGGNGDQSDVERVVHTHASCLPPKVFDGASSADRCPSPSLSATILFLNILDWRTMPLSIKRLAIQASKTI